MNVVINFQVWGISILGEELQVSKERLCLFVSLFVHLFVR